jgi:HD-GYP domain-containing protein (c-di-GMP phosphodiesterase class II)
LASKFYEAVAQAEIVHMHHERMDGSGYPRNLQGEEILMEVRILAGANMAEAMVSQGSYISLAV